MYNFASQIPKGITISVLNNRNVVSGEYEDINLLG